MHEAQYLEVLCHLLGWVWESAPHNMWGKMTSLRCPCCWYPDFKRAPFECVRYSCCICSTNVVNPLINDFAPPQSTTWKWRCSLFFFFFFFFRLLVLLSSSFSSSSSSSFSVPNIIVIHHHRHHKVGSMPHSTRLTLTLRTSTTAPTPTVNEKCKHFAP